MKLPVAVSVASIVVALVVGRGDTQEPQWPDLSAGAGVVSTSSPEPPESPDVIGTSVSTVPIVETLVTSEAAASARPTRLRVDALGLDVEVMAVGVDGRGRFDVPAPAAVGWYQHGPMPGGPGSSVLAAHVDWNGRPGAFFGLHQLELGARLDVEFSDGTVRAFSVVSHDLYDKAQLPADELFRRDGSAVLRLVTCGGTFDPAAKSYRGNRVVTAVALDPLG